MSAPAIRTHVLVPRDLLEAVDRVAGKRRRSDFMTEALREKLTREFQKQALAATAGALAHADYPEWSTPEKTSRWVHDQRRAVNSQTATKLRGNSQT